MRKLEMMKQRRSNLDAEVRFLRRRYKHLKQDQTLETSSRHVENPKGREGRGSVQTPLLFLILMEMGGALTNSPREKKKEPERMCGQVLAEATKKEVLGDGIDDLRGGMKLPICRDVEKELNNSSEEEGFMADPWL
ncbi:hypothetical protein Rs2_44938 [Raphanus sativus]|nr:hypothetical protein Rs2_44938 [Raphanus sativus]